MNPKLKVVAIFCLAGFISASIFSSYSSGVHSLYEENSARHRRGSNPNSPGYDPAGAYRAWYTQNVSLTKYADRQWTVLCLGFPVAMSLALVIALGAGWLPGVPGERIFLTLLPIYAAPVLVLLFSAVSRFVLLLPALAGAAFLFRWSVEIFRSRRSRIVLALVISATVCCLLALSMLAISQAFFLIALETIWAGLYGMALTGSDFSRGN